MATVGDHTLAVGRETTVGTAVSPTRRFETVSESLKLNIERIESKALKNSRRFLASTGWAAGQRSVEGDLELEVPSAGFGTLLRCLLGEPTTTADSPVTGTHVHVFSGQKTVDTEALTFEIARTDIGGTQHKFTYNGCKLTDGEFSASVGEYVTAKFTVNGWDETVSAAAPTSASYPSLLGASSKVAGPLVFTGASLTVAGSSADVKEASFKIETGLKTDRYFLGSAVRKNQVEADMRTGSGQLTVEWSGLTQYQRFVNGTTAALVFTAETQNAIVGTTKGYLKIEVPVARFDGETPTGGGDIIEQSVDFVALDDGTNDPFKVTYLSADTSY